MKKKFYLVAALLGAMTLGTSCVDDNESASVTAVRTAKAEQLSALATKAKAEAEAAIITAEAEKAYKDALTKYTEEMTAEAKAKFEAELEALKAEYEARIKKAKLDALEAEQDFMDKAEGYLATLYSTYSEAANKLTDLKRDKADQEYYLTQYKAELAEINEWIAQQTSLKEKDIKEKEAEIAAWEKYTGYDKFDLETQVKELTQQKYGAYKVKDEAEKAQTKAREAATDVINPYSVYSQEPSTVKAVAALQKFYELTNARPNSYSDQQIKIALAKGYINEKNYRGNNVWNVIANVYDAETGQLLPLAPIGEQEIILNEEPVINVYQYITSDLNKEVVNKYIESLKTGETENLEELKEAIAELEASLKEKQDALPALEEAFAAAEKAYNDALAVEEAAEAKVEEAWAAYEPIYAEQDGYQKEYAKAEREYNAANEEYWAQEQLKNNYTAKKNNATADKENNTTWKTQAEATLAQLKEDLKNATSEQKPAIEAQIKQTEEEIARYTAAIAEAEAVIKRADGKIEAANKAMEAANKARTAADKAKDAAQAKLNALQTKFQDAYEAKEAAERAWRAAQAETQALREPYYNAENTLNQAKQDIQYTEQQLAEKKGELMDKEINPEETLEIEAAWKEVVAALNADYEAEVKALAENETVKAYVTAVEAYDEAKEAYDKIVAEIGVLNDLIVNGEAFDPAAEIETLKLAIVQLKKEIVDLKEMGLNGDSAMIKEKAIAYAEAAIEKLEGQIAIQEEIVKAAKKRVDDYLAQSGK